jgi:hypothetical protein
LTENSKFAGVRSAHLPRDLGARLAVERRVHLDGIEVLGVESELVEPFGRRRAGG